MNKIIKNTLILAAITVVSGLVLGAAYEVTKVQSHRHRQSRNRKPVSTVYPEADSFEGNGRRSESCKEAIKKMGTNSR